MFGGAFSVTHIMIVAGVAVLLFGRNAVKGWMDLGINTIKDFRHATKEIREPIQEAHKELRDMTGIANNEISDIKRNISPLG